MRGKPKPGFTLEEAIAELRRATLESEEGVFTTAELCERLGYPQRSSSFTNWMRRWVSEGLVEYAGEVYRPCIDRKMRPIPAYRWVGDKQEEKGGE